MEKNSFVLILALVVIQVKCTLADDNNDIYDVSNLNSMIHIDPQLFIHSPELQPDDEAEEHTEDGCYLMWFEKSVKASYLCHEGVIWTVSIVPEGDGCIYRRNLTDVSEHINLQEVAINCTQGKKWLQNLVQHEMLPAIPDEEFFITHN